MLAHELGMSHINRARMRLLLCDADLRQKLDQDLGLDLEFSCQFIDADLIGICHSPLSFRLRSCRSHNWMRYYSEVSCFSTVSSEAGDDSSFPTTAPVSAAAA